MMYIRVTVHDHQELDCRTFSLTKTFSEPTNMAILSSHEIGDRVRRYVEDTCVSHREAYPRGRSFTIPIVEVAVGRNLDEMARHLEMVS